jgi:hypothetical protein
MTDAELTKKIDLIEGGPAIIQAAVAGITPEVLDYKPAPDKWSIREIVAHLADIEILYGYRLRQMMADDKPVIAPIDQDAWAANLRYSQSDLAEALERHRVERRGTVRLLRQLKAEDLKRGAFHPERNRIVTIEELIGMMAVHEPNHHAQIERLKQQAAQGARA